MPRVQRGKVSATFEAREAAGCGSLRLLCALRGTRILQAAAPTAPQMCIRDSFKKVYNVNMNGHSAESYTVVWLFKTAIEKAGSTDGAAVRDALAELSIDGAFEGGRKIVLPYSKIEFAPEYEIGGAKHYRDNTYASVAIAQVQDQEWKTVWPFEFASSKIQEVTLG